MINVSRWIDPKTQSYSCEIDPVGRTCDNSLLFTAEAYRLGLMPLRAFECIVEQYEPRYGVLSRYPGSKDYCSYDDYLGACAVSEAFSLRAMTFFKLSGWRNQAGDRLWRFPILIPTVTAGAGLRLSFIQEVLVCLCFLANCLESKQSTSGRLLLWTVSPLFSDYILASQCIRFWKWVLSHLYSSPSELFKIYFPDKQGIEHPFVSATPSSF